MSFIGFFKKLLFLSSFGVLIFGMLFTPAVASAQGVTATGVDLTTAIGFKACNVSGGAQASNPGKLQECVGAILNFALIMAGLVAVVQLAINAFMYFNPETKTNTIQDSIGHIRNIFIGLMLIAGPVLILRTFNIALTNFNFLGFSASQSKSTGTNVNPSSSTSGSTTANADQKIGNTTLTGDPTKDLNSILDQAKNPSLDGVTAKNFTDALNYTLKNGLNLSGTGFSDQNLSTLNSIFDALKSAGINFNVDPNALAALNSSGKNADGSGANLANVYCYSSDCKISGGTITGNPQILTVTLNNKNNNPVNYLIRLNPVNTVPTALKGYISITPNPNGGNSTVSVTNPNITSSDFINWCNAAQQASSSSSAGGAACYNSPTSTSGVVYAL